MASFVNAMKSPDCVLCCGKIWFSCYCHGKCHLSCQCHEGWRFTCQCHGKFWFSCQCHGNWIIVKCHRKFLCRSVSSRAWLVRLCHIIHISRKWKFLVLSAERGWYQKVWIIMFFIFYLSVYISPKLILTPGNLKNLDVKKNNKKMNLKIPFPPFFLIL